jgi:hypothetical protein
MRSLFQLGAALLLAAVALVPAHAQSIILRPAAVPLKGQVGQSVTQTLTLQNDSDIALEFDLQAQDVVVRDGRRVFVEAGKVEGSIAATAVMQPTHVRVEPRSSATATVMFTLPRGMRHRAVVALFKGTTPVASANRRAFMSIGTLFTFSVGGTVSVKGKLDATPPGQRAGAAFISTLVNDGTEPVVPTGMVILTDANGRIVGRSDFTPRRLLPGETVPLVAEYPGDLESGTYRAIATFDVDGRPYTLTSPLLVP